MKNLSIIVLLLLVPIFSIAQSSIFKGASLTIGHLEQELGNSCYIFLIDSEDATWVKIEYSDRSYIIEIQLYEDDYNDIPSSSF